MTPNRGRYETGHKPKCLLSVDESGEWNRALCYTSFFFQAEDGIRDSSVTGVQTCALPICSHHWRRAIWQNADIGHANHGQPVPTFSAQGSARSHGANGVSCFARTQISGKAPEIGRASCRERV